MGIGCTHAVMEDHPVDRDGGHAVVVPDLARDRLARTALLECHTQRGPLSLSPHGHTGVGADATAGSNLHPSAAVEADARPHNLRTSCRVRLATRRAAPHAPIHNDALRMVAARRVTRPA